MSVRGRLTHAADSHLRGTFLAYAKRWIAQKSDEQLLTIMLSVRDWTNYILDDNGGNNDG